VHPLVIVATHQPIFSPWPGFFAKALCADRMVLLDNVQFPRGRTWLNRNRLKNETGELWLTVPVWKTGRGVQVVGRVEIYHERGWQHKHLQGIQQNYARAPYFKEYFERIESIYHQTTNLLVDLNLSLIRFLWQELSFEVQLLRQSELGITGKGTQLLVDICQHLGGDRLAIFPGVEKHLDLDHLQKHGIGIHHVPFHPVVYPQLWGDFIYNLSTLDLLLNCGPKSRDVLAQA